MTDRSLAAAPLLPPAAAFAIGIAAASWLTLPSPVLLAVGTTLLIAALATAARRPRLSLALVLVAVATLGVLRAASPPLPDDHVARLGREGALTIEGRLGQEPVRWAPDRVRLLLDAEAAHLGPERLSATGRVQLTIYGELASPLGEGQRVLVDARVHPPIGYRNPGSFDYARWLLEMPVLDDKKGLPQAYALPR